MYKKCYIEIFFKCEKIKVISKLYYRRISKAKHLIFQKAIGLLG